MDLFGIHFVWYLEVLFLLYAAWAIVLILLDEREPATTMAWIFFVLLMPLVGIAVYIFAGRNLRVVRPFESQRRAQTRKYLSRVVKPWIVAQPALVEKVAKSLPTSAHRRLLRLNASTSTSLLTGKNKVKILQNGAKKFPQLVKDLMTAEDYIHMAYFIWGDDEVTGEVADALIDRAKAGVKVRVLYDALGSVGYMNRRYKKRLRDAGVEIYGARAINSIANLAASNNRNHTKVVIIDGRIGYNGGMNMAEEYVSGGKKYPSWRDTQIRIEGEGIVALQAVFAVNWLTTRGEELPKKYFDVVVPKDAKTPVQLVYSSPYTQREAIKMMYAEMITSAQKSVRIQSPYFIPDLALIEALRNAALAGIDVKVMITGIPDKKSVLAAGYSYFHSIMEAGVEVYLYKAGFLHAKALSIDGEVCTVGSANFDTRSFNLNFEATNVVYDPKVARGFEADFADDMKRSERFSVAQWKSLPFAKRLYMSVCRLASPLL